MAGLGRAGARVGRSVERKKSKTCRGSPMSIQQSRDQNTCVRKPPQGWREKSHVKGLENTVASTTQIRKTHNSQGIG